MEHAKAAVLANAFHKDTVFRLNRLAFPDGENISGKAVVLRDEHEVVFQPELGKYGLKDVVGKVIVRIPKDINYIPLLQYGDPLESGLRVPI